MGKIIVIGSINMDLLFRTEKRPSPGETVKGIEFAEFPGGKGANQAVAAARLGADVKLISSVGKDRYGEFLLSHLENEGVDTSKVKQSETSTGLANIILDSNGENSIIIIEGANGFVSPDDIDESMFTKDDIVLLQLEIPMETVLFVAKTAKKKGAKVVLDPAPVKELPEEIYQYIDIIKPNKGEALELTGADTVDEAAAYLAAKGVPVVIITLGGDGVNLYKDNTKNHFPSKKVQVVDTTAAGDSFSGALATAILRGDSIDTAIEFAIKVASITVTRLGAQSSLPKLDEIGGK